MRALPPSCASPFAQLTRVPASSVCRLHSSLLLNQAVATLSDPAQRTAYDDLLGAARFARGAAPGEGMRAYTGESFSPWVGEDPRGGGWASRAVFVDEGTCIGCKNCAGCAGKTFAMEEEWGRARVTAQWADTEADIQTAIDSCPVDCISWCATL